MNELIQNKETICWICINRDRCERYSDCLKGYCKDWEYGDLDKPNGGEENY